MELLLRVAEAGSMTVAARQLQRTPAAVSAAVGRIESAMDVRLFERTTRSLHPTDEGLVFLEGCRDVVERWQRALEAARGSAHELVGMVHLSAPADTAYSILGPILGDLSVEHPGLKVVVHSSDAVAQLHRDAIDMAVRYGPLQDSGLLARKLVDAPTILVASPGYLSRAGAPTSPEDLAEHRCLTLRLSGMPVETWELWHDDARAEVEPRSALCGDGYLIRRWALDGRGIARKSAFDVVDELETGALVRVLPDHVARPMPIHVIFPGRRLRRFVGLLVVPGVLAVSPPRACLPGA